MRGSSCQVPRRKCLEHATREGVIGGWGRENSRKGREGKARQQGHGEGEWD